ncbi:MAG: carbohydrate ABC transporter permease [Bacteroidota bacterium]
MNTINSQKVVRNTVVYTFLLLFIFFSLLPLLWMLSTSVKPEALTREFPPKIIPGIITLENYKYLIEGSLIPRYLFNSFFMGIITILGVLFFGTLAAYGFSRYEFRGKSLLLVLMLASVMISGATIIVPLYLMFLKLNLINTQFSLFLVYVVQALPISTWLLKAHFDSLPVALDEAAMLDGCSRLKILYRIIIPESVPGLTAVSLYTLVLVWREFIMASTFITKNELKTLPVGVYQFFTELGIEWGKLGATVMMAILPMTILFIVFQRYFNPAEISSGVK